MEAARTLAMAAAAESNTSAVPADMAEGAARSDFPEGREALALVD
jgi:hypothetical protein